MDSEQAHPALKLPKGYDVLLVVRNTAMFEASVEGSIPLLRSKYYDK